MRDERVRRVATLTTPSEVRAHLDQLGLRLPFDDTIGSDAGAPLARPLSWTDGSAGTRSVGNRFAILPMEGWDGTADGHPTDLVRRRWERFGRSGAKLIWGGEAFAVRADGRANPRQLVLDADTVEDVAALRQRLVDAHQDEFGDTNGLFVGIQLTHSGRFARPAGDPRPLIAYRHPYLDARAGGVPRLLRDDELDELVRRFAGAAVLAQDAGFDFVDVKACHGYLGHEMLSAIDRPGDYGGAFEGRTRFLTRIVETIRATSPTMAVGVRLSAYDVVPFAARQDGIGAPSARGGYRYAFGGDGTGLGIDLHEPHQLLTRLHELGVGAVCVTAGSPYYSPHIQRPAYFPPSDGYLPPNDPLVDVIRLIDVTAELSRAHPGIRFVGSGYSYLQQWLPHVAQRMVTDGAVDVVGIGRMALSYPTLPADVLAGRPLQRRFICRTFSDCTTAPRHGVVSGCYPLDPFYRALPERRAVQDATRAGRSARDIK